MSEPKSTGKRRAQRQRRTGRRTVRIDANEDTSITRIETQSLVVSRVIMAVQRQGHRSPALRTTLHRPPARRPVKTFAVTRSGPLSGPQSCQIQTD